MRKFHSRESYLKRTPNVDMVVTWLRLKFKFSHFPYKINNDYKELRPSRAESSEQMRVAGDNDREPVTKVAARCAKYRCTFGKLGDSVQSLRSIIIVVKLRGGLHYTKDRRTRRYEEVARLNTSRPRDAPQSLVRKTHAYRRTGNSSLPAG